MTPALILCALKRHRGPLSTTDVCDAAAGLATSAGWPDSRAIPDGKHVESMLKRLVREKLAQAVPMPAGAHR